MSISITPERFAQGRTFEEYLDYLGTPENLTREATDGSVRIDRSKQWRDLYDALELESYQVEAMRLLAEQTGGPAKVLVISEDWSSDCRRDVPMFARLAEAGGLEMRVFDRDGAKFSSTTAPTDSPNADLMSQFLNTKENGTFQSIPVAAFFTKDFEYLYHYTEYPAIYHKDRVVYGHIRVPRAGESADDTRSRIDKEFGALQQSPFFRIWASAGAEEIISALHRKLLIGAV